MNVNHNPFKKNQDNTQIHTHIIHKQYYYINCKPNVYLDTENNVNYIYLRNQKNYVNKR